MTSKEITLSDKISEPLDLKLRLSQIENEVRSAEESIKKIKETAEREISLILRRKNISPGSDEGRKVSKEHKEKLLSELKKTTSRLREIANELLRAHS